MDANEAITFPAPLDVTIDERDVPEPGADEVLVKTTRSLISTGTELTLLTGNAPADSTWAEIGGFPIEDPGYCNVGEIVAVGANVATDLLGTRVASWQSHRRYNLVAEADVHAIPESVSDEEAAFFALAVTAMNGIRTGEVTWGEGVGIYGQGLLGQLAARFVSIAGARPVVCLDVASSRLDWLPDASGIVGLNPHTDDVVDRVEELTDGRLADVVVEVTGNPDAIPDEFDILRDQGRLVLLSSPDGPTEFDFHDYCNRGSYSIHGAHVYAHPEVATPSNPWTRARHVELFFQYLAEGSLDVTSLISHRVPYDRAPKMYESLYEDRRDALGVILEW